MTLPAQANTILGPQVPIGDSWFDQTQVSMARILGERCPVLPPTDPAGLDSYTQHLSYYDLAKSEAIVHKRTGDPIFLAYSNKAADCQWQYPGKIQSGQQRDFYNGQGPAPRNAGLAGLMLRAPERPVMWDWIVEYTKAMLDIWLKWRLTNSSLHVGVREGAFTLHYAIWLSQVLPDSYPLQAGGTATNGAQLRAQFLSDAESIAINYYARLQFADGSWRWDDFDVRDPDGSTLRGLTQPFQIGLLLHALIDLHQITPDPLVRETVKNMILKGCRHLYSDGPYRKDDPVPYDRTKRWRCFWYFYHGGTELNPTKFANGGWSLPGINADEISDARQGNGTVVSAYAYAYKISSDNYFLEAFNELWDASYGGSDGIRNLMATGGKGFNQNCRRSGSGLVWAGGVSAPLPTPVPLPIPSPVPTPQPTPAPAPIPDPLPLPPTPVSISVIVPQSGATVSGRVTVTARATDESVITAAYLLVNGLTSSSAKTAPYAFEWDTTMRADGEYRLMVRGWRQPGEPPVDSPEVIVKVSNQLPAPTPAPIPPDPVPVPTPTPTPEPPKPPVTPCSISAPESISIPRNSSGTIAATINNVSEPTDITVSGSDGQVSVTPLFHPVNPTASTVVQFRVRTKNKRQMRVITLRSGCGVREVKVSVT
jgi:hypothetical protein